MDVWDKTISPKKGKVIEIFTDYDYDFPIKVEFENNVKVQYTTEGCFVKNKGAVPTLSTTDYSVEMKDFEQKALVPTFEEAWTETERIYEPKSEYDKEEFGGYPSQELANAAEALRRLLFLRVYYNEFYQPDCDETCYNDEFVIEPSSANYPNVLSFESKKNKKTIFRRTKRTIRNR